MPAAILAPADSTAKPSAWSQEWRDVLFAHWRVPAQALEPHVPPGLELDLRDGSAWVSAVAFNLETRRFGVSLRFPELNLRTYVRRGDEHAVLFLSLHAGHRLGAAVAKRPRAVAVLLRPNRCTRTAAARRFEFTSTLFNAECRLGQIFTRQTPARWTNGCSERYVGYTSDRPAVVPASR